MANDKFFLAKKTSATLTSAQVDTLRVIGTGGSYTAAQGSAVADAAAATAAADDADLTEIIADVAAIRVQLNLLLAQLRSIPIIAT